MNVMAKMNGDEKLYIYIHTASFSKSAIRDKRRKNKIGTKTNKHNYNNNKKTVHRSTCRRDQSF